MKKIVYVICFLFLYAISNAQDVKPFIPGGETKYYDFWEGEWHKVLDGKIDTMIEFKVIKSINPASFYEVWSMVIDSALTLHAVALRAWDKTNNRWMYTWVSENGLYQIWEGRKVNDNWYIYKEFDINGDKYLSRQAWIPLEKNRLMRISEKSYDHGITWQLRFKEYFVKNIDKN